MKVYDTKIIDIPRPQKPVLWSKAELPDRMGQSVLYEVWREGLVGNNK